MSLARADYSLVYVLDTRSFLTETAPCSKAAKLYHGESALSKAGETKTAPAAKSVIASDEAIPNYVAGDCFGPNDGPRNENFLVGASAVCERSEAIPTSPIRINLAGY
jgi:hypothetical protein